MKAECHACEQQFDYKIINIHYNSICPSCLEKDPGIMEQINEVYEEYYRAIDEASRIYDEADERAYEVLNATLILILDKAK